MRYPSKPFKRQSQTIQNGNIVSTTTYAYNEQNRLIRTTTTVKDTTSGTVPYAHNNNANLTPIEPILVDEGIIYAYDNNGNLINKRKTILNSEDTKNNALFAPVIGERLKGLSKDSVLNEYDSLNRLIKSTADGKTNTYEYNGENIRVSKSVNGENRRYLYEGDKIILEVDENGSQKARNIYGTNIVSRKVENSSDKYYYLFNGHGDVTNLTGSDSKILATYYYDAFGVPTETTGNVDNPIRYASYQYDEETGNYYLMSRMYDPVIARFLQEDTYRGELNDPLSLNLYTYTHNNPITYDDPNGHWIHIAIGAAIGVAINVGITAYLDYKDDHKFNSGWREYAGAAVEGAITGSIGAATGGASLFTMITAEVASGFVGSAARQYISKGKVSLKKSATDAAFNGIGFVAGHYAGKALTPVKKAIAQSKVVTKTKGLVLDGLSSKSDTILSLNKKIGESVQNVFEKINLPTQNKLAFSSAGGGGRSGIEATFDYVDESVMKNFNKVYSSETLQSTVKNIDNNISSSIKGAGKADFYVKPNGDVIPSTGYRYMSETAPYLDELNKTKVIPSNANGTYFSFDKYNVASPGKLQVPHDASVRGSFDTLQIIDDIRVPNGNWGKASYLEPLTKDFPEFGPGGATQVITNGKITLDKITKLPK